MLNILSLAVYKGYLRYKLNVPNYTNCLLTLWRSVLKRRHNPKVPWPESVKLFVRVVCTLVFVFINEFSPCCLLAS